VAVLAGMRLVFNAVGDVNGCIHGCLLVSKAHNPAPR